ncbi:hypothetical protein CH63R_02326 [Colletotrichum higginsianum IMI 349063]|uniref:Uncharacterized protein n=1 Tax=Colletotrichum higginsianum (strain IMI 349063) TaxID=759273 RepID=A0A1B7YNI1_COLHI|nr:hypothetical protein CH63R_02326 [Colletotrichum higginsianum IMI 349063]OBR13600.1 hypothetical protein CH63R_02326 [Colletotrichum higginsianum IMI 349063]
MLRRPSRAVYTTFRFEVLLASPLPYRHGLFSEKSKLANSQLAYSNEMTTTIADGRPVGLQIKYIATRASKRSLASHHMFRSARQIRFLQVHTPKPEAVPMAPFLFEQHCSVRDTAP